MGELARRGPVAVGELVDPDGLAALAAEVAARGRSPETQRTYAAVFRSFKAFLGPGATRDDLTPAAVRAYRDALAHAGRSPATIAKHLSALRGLANTLGADVAHPHPCAPLASRAANPAP